MLIKGKIAGGGKDYYDSMQAYGVDKERIYLRNTHPEKYKEGKGLATSKIGIIGFCGNLYPFYFTEIDLTMYSDDSWNHTLTKEEIAERKSKIVYIPQDMKDDDLKKWMEELEEKTKSKEEKQTHYKYSKYRWWRSGNLFSDYKAIMNSEYLKSLFLREKEPVFFYMQGMFGYNWRIYRKYNILFNPMLKHFNFQQVKEPYTAYQELEMYLGSQLVEHPKTDPTTGSNEVIGRSKGFDEFSFRHPNTKKKPKKF